MIPGSNDVCINVLRAACCVLRAINTVILCIKLNYLFYFLFCLEIELFLKELLLSMQFAELINVY